MRVIVCGSRNWEGRWAEQKVSDVLFAFEDLAVVLGEQLTIIHGGCPTGADAIADRWARRGMLEPEVYPADWAQFGKQAGPFRNKLMAKSGAHACLAFWRGQSRGTENMIMEARAARIWTKVIPWFNEKEPVHDPVGTSALPKTA